MRWWDVVGMEDTMCQSGGGWAYIQSIYLRPAVHLLALPRSNTAGERGSLLIDAVSRRSRLVDCFGSCARKKRGGGGLL